MMDSVREHAEGRGGSAGRCPRPQRPPHPGPWRARLGSDHEGGDSHDSSRPVQHAQRARAGPPTAARDGLRRFLRVRRPPSGSWLNAGVADSSGRRLATEHVRALLSAWVDYEESGDRELLEGISHQAVDDALADRSLANDMIGLLSALAAAGIRMLSAQRSESPQKVLQDL